MLLYGQEPKDRPKDGRITAYVIAGGVVWLIAVNLKFWTGE